MLEVDEILLSKGWKTSNISLLTNLIREDNVRNASQPNRLEDVIVPSTLALDKKTT
jgi:hypothetical protein